MIECALITPARWRYYINAASKVYLLLTRRDKSFVTSCWLTFVFAASLFPNSLQQPSLFAIFYEITLFSFSFLSLLSGSHLISLVVF